MPLSTAEQLRLLNLAYMQMQADFKRILPDLFRATTQSLTTDASGYIYLDASSFEVELIVKQTGGENLEPMSKELKYVSTGWFHDGADTTLGKLRIMVRLNGAAWASLPLYVECLKEFPELTALDDIPYPFVQQRYLNMLTELQTFMFHMEGGKEQAGEAEKHWNAYQFLLGQVKKDALNKRPQFMATAGNDAGDGRNYPLLNQ